VDVEDGGPSFRRESHTTSDTGDDNLHIFQDPIIKETMPFEQLRNPSNDYDTIGNLPDIGFNETEPNMDFKLLKPHQLNQLDNKLQFLLKMVPQMHKFMEVSTYLSLTFTYES
jgi:hypothetical protein